MSIMLLTSFKRNRSPKGNIVDSHYKEYDSNVALKRPWISLIYHFLFFTFKVINIPHSPYPWAEEANWTYIRRSVYVLCSGVGSLLILFYWHCLKKVSVFGVTLVRMRENAYQSNSENGHFWRSVTDLCYKIDQNKYKTMCQLVL